MQRILIIGATGNIGLPTTRALLQSGAQLNVRVLVRSEEKFRNQLGDLAKSTNLEIRAGDFSNPTDLQEALKDVNKLFFLVPFVENAPDIATKIVDAAVNAKVSYIVKLSAMGADDKSTSKFGKFSGDQDTRLKASGIKYTILKPTYFHVNLLEWGSLVKQKGIVVSSEHPTDKKSWIDPRDIAAVAAKALIEGSEDNKEYELTGDVLTNEELVQLLSKAIGKEIKWVVVSEEDVRKNMESIGVPAWMIPHLLDLDAFVRNGLGATVTSTFKDLMKRDHIHISQWINENLSAFQ